MLEEDDKLKEQQESKEINKWLKKANLNILNNKNVVNSSVASLILAIFNEFGTYANNKPINVLNQMI